MLSANRRAHWKKYHSEAQKALRGNFKFTFTPDELTATVKCAEQQVAAVDSMFTSMIKLGSKKWCGKPEKHFKEASLDNERFQNKGNNICIP